MSLRRIRAKEICFHHLIGIRCKVCNRYITWRIVSTCPCHVTGQLCAGDYRGWNCEMYYTDYAYCSLVMDLVCPVKLI